MTRSAAIGYAVALVSSLLLTGCVHDDGIPLTAEMGSLELCPEPADSIRAQDLPALPLTCDHARDSVILPGGEEVGVGDFGGVHERFWIDVQGRARSVYITNLGTKGVVLATTICSEQRSTFWGTTEGVDAAVKAHGHKMPHECT